MKVTVGVTTSFHGGQPKFSTHSSKDLPATIQIGIRQHADNALPEFVTISVAEDGTVSVKRLQLTPAMADQVTMATTEVSNEKPKKKTKKKTKKATKRR